MCEFHEPTTRDDYRAAADYDCRVDAVDDYSLGELSAMIPDNELRQLLLDNINRPAVKNLDDYSTGELMDYIETDKLKNLLRSHVLEKDYDLE